MVFHNAELKTESLWTLKMVKFHNSFRSAKTAADLFFLMLPDSQITSEFKCGVFGLAPHFFKLLQDSVKSSYEYVL